MARGLNEFLKGLIVENGETSQIEIAEEAIKKQLFIIMREFDMENGQTVKLNEIVKMISDKLGIQRNKRKVAQIVMKIFQSGEYNYKINEKGNIEAVYSKADILQKQRDEEIHEEAENVLHEFIERTEQYAEQLSQQKVKVTEITLMKMFSEKELEKNHGWIDLAIDYVLEKQNQER